MKQYLVLWYALLLTSIASISADEHTINLMPPEDLVPLTKAIFLYTANSGSAFPIANNLNILGGTGITTSAEQSTVSIDATGTIADSFLTDSGTAMPSSNTIDMHGGSNINTSGSGSTVTINLDNSPSVSGSVTAGAGLIATTGGINATGNSSIAGGTITLNSGTNALNISTDSSATNVSIATGAAAKTVTLGSTSGASSLVLQAGTGGISFNGTATATTQPANDDSTKLATTAYADNSNPYRLLSTQTISSAVSSVQFISLPAGYTSFQIKWYGVVPATSSEALCLQFSTNNGSTWIAAGYYGVIMYDGVQGDSNVSGSATINGANFPLSLAMINTVSGYASSGELNITNIGASQTFFPAFYGRITYLYSNVPYVNMGFNGGYVLTAACDAFQLFFASGNILSGTFELYAVL